MDSMMVWSVMGAGRGVGAVGVRSDVIARFDTVHL
jgi:hypothetical protein